ncbi:MAG: response regulator [Acetanaerobacterium sp.]
MTILVIDDDIQIVKGITTIIRNMNLEGVEMLAASNAMDALDILKYNRADLVITDIDMPMMSGLDLVREAKEWNYCQNFIILSGYDNFEFMRKAIQYGITDYLLKPINKEELQRLVQNIHAKLWGDRDAEPIRMLNSIPSIPIYNIETDPQRLPEKLARIVQYLQLHFRQDLSLEKLGEVFHLNPNYICTLFQSHMQTTFLQYINCLRLQKGVALLLNQSDLPVEKVAVSSGFINERQFYKTFKKLVGTTPGAFRKANHNIHIVENPSEENMTKMPI